MAEFAKTQAEAAEKVGVSRASMVDWARRTDFPKPTKRGWNVDRIRAFAEKHGLGKSGRGKRGGAPTTANGVTLTEANIRFKTEQAEIQRIEKEQRLLEQAKQLGQVVAVEDVRKLYLQTIATVTAVLDSVTDAADRTLPETCPSPESWKDLRARTMALLEKLKADVAAAMEEIKQ